MMAHASGTFAKRAVIPANNPLGPVVFNMNCNDFLNEASSF